MANTFQEARKVILSAPAEERSSLVEELIDSLATEEEREFDAQHIDEWERRYREYKNGEAVVVPLEEVMRKIRAKHGGGRSS